MNHPYLGKIAKLRSNGARFAVVAVTDKTVTLQGWAGQHTLNQRDFAIRYEVLGPRSRDGTLMSHTKGGWNRNIPPAAKYPIIFAGRNTHVCQILSKGLPDSEIEANANLVAAAPRMFEALTLISCGPDAEMAAIAQKALACAQGDYS